MAEITVRSLIHLLHDLGTGQADVARALRVSRAMTTYWAKGVRPLASRSWPAFMALVRGAIVDHHTRQADVIHWWLDAWLAEVNQVAWASWEGVPMLLRVLGGSPVAQADPAVAAPEDFPVEEWYRLHNAANNLSRRLDMVITIGRWLSTVPGTDQEPRPLARFEAAEALFWEAVRPSRGEKDVEASGTVSGGGGRPAHGRRRAKT
jgi:DNA-binding transcriptional regulator YdaS (Cro superfamily)